MTNKQGSVNTETYYMIKIGDSFIKEINTMSNFDEPDEALLRDLSVVVGEGRARKWYFDSESSVQDSEQHGQEKHFSLILDILKKNGIDYKVLKTKVTTSIEQEEFASKQDEASLATDVINHVYNISMGAGLAGTDIATFMKEINERLKRTQRMR